MELINQNKEYKIIKRELIKYSRKIYKKGFVVAYEGNLSYRTKENYVWVTPTKKCKGLLKKNDLVLLDLDGTILYSKKNNKPTSEALMHLEIYKHRKDIQAIIHSHPPYTVALTLTGISLEEFLLPEIFLVLGKVPTAKYALTGTKEMFEAIQPHLQNNAILLSHHGVITFGENLEEAYFRLEQLEHSAKIISIAHQIGNIQRLPEYRKQEIIELQKKYLQKE